jgi:hypothetical protein
MPADRHRVYKVFRPMQVDKGPFNVFNGKNRRPDMLDIFSDFFIRCKIIMCAAAK